MPFLPIAQIIVKCPRTDSLVSLDVCRKICGYGEHTNKMISRPTETPGSDEIGIECGYIGNVDDDIRKPGEY